jgi:lactate dehydrogenase-like 2-hydroxyacid dehydrogenase
MSQDVIVVAPILARQMAQLEATYRLHRWDLADDKDAFAASVADRVRAAVTTGTVGISGALMDRLPALEVVGCMAVGVDAVDLPHARARGIAVTNTPDVLNDCVADTAMGLLLASMRKLVLADRYVRAGQWVAKGAMPLTTSLKGKTLGILGLGRIGMAIAKRAEPFGLTIVYHTRRKRDDVPYRHYADLVAMARDVDILLAILPGGPETRRIVDRAVLEALGPTGTFVNVARGSVCDEPALVEALRTGKLGAAALDVFEDEPRVPDALLTMDNVVLAPHVGSATVETRDAMSQLVVDNLAAHFAGRPLLTPV